MEYKVILVICDAGGFLQHFPDENGVQRDEQDYNR